MGDRVPVCSVGRAILGQHSADERRAIYRKVKFEGFSTTTRMSAETIEDELRMAQERGFHQSSSEYIPDLAVVSLALPIGPRQSIVVAGPTSRCLERRPITAAIMKEAILQHQSALKINV